MNKDEVGTVIQMLSERIYMERMARRLYDECSGKYNSERNCLDKHNCLSVGYCIDPSVLARGWYWYCKSN